MFFTQWLSLYAERLATERFNRGYNQAAGALLRGRLPEEVDMWVDYMFEPTEYDEGLIAALTAWRNLIESTPMADGPSAAN
jgi:hypothetical protein